MAVPKPRRAPRASSEQGGAVDDFEVAVAQLEEVMMDAGFNERVGAFMAANCHEFEEGDENKLS